MINVLIFLFITLVPLLCSGTVFTKDGQPKKALLEVLDALYIPHTTRDCSVYEAVFPLLRKAGTERKDLTEKELTYEQKTELMSAFEILGFVKEVKPEEKCCDDVLVLGSYAQDLKMRLEYLVTLWNRGLRFKRLFFLTGERPRDLERESDRQIFFKQKKDVEVKTETDIMKVIWGQLDKPEDLESIEPIIIHAGTPNGRQRPNTLHTVEEFIKLYSPQEGTWIAITTQPYVPYQEAILKRTFSASYKGMAVGPKSSAKVLFSNYLDTFARTVHNEFWITHPECAIKN